MAKRRIVNIETVVPQADETKNPFESVIAMAEMTSDGNTQNIDLHGEDSETAVSLADQFLHQQFLAGESVVKIIHGRGTGALRRAVAAMLKNHPVVEYFRDSLNTSELGGVTYVALARRSK
ncbi:MAG: recombination and DNA strand exchange inhibitor protein [Candidatus Uhrbacteria bacterium GW2011_GWA2_53_10]|uniref:Recombination and DNA strand exchange inhibitor protein n=1 Tax=Candidatus Uhrbacteria bacterium GW2011_GWA2_53_10 TaxID=1618980 RepID=A0A0G1XQR7_9BACT|nr:MAG: recombination and DNA strand exchange inhibitor protein [Candidatus Uhrbacteria bacterium GW2011_GWA2_53_10]